MFNFFGRKKSSEDTEALAKKQSIARIFSELLEEHRTLTLTFLETKKQYSSMIISLDFENNQFALDEILNKAGHQLMLDGAPFVATAKDSGITVKFKSHCLSKGIDGDYSYYNIELPSTVDYQQRRGSFRVTVDLGYALSVFIKRGNGKLLKGTLEDISLHGAGIRIKTDVSELLKTGESLTSCEIHISSDAVIDTPATICHVFYDNRKHCTDFGVSFAHLSAEQQRHINRLITDLQRQARRREMDED